MATAMATEATAPAAEEIAATAAVLDAMSQPIRLAILWHLDQGERCVTELCELVQRRQQAVSHHLTILKLRELVVLRRRGKNNFYVLTEAGQEALGRVRIG